MPQKVEIILASGSPRRRELLEREGEQWVVIGLEPDLAVERQHVCVQRQKARVGQAALVLAGFFPRVGEVDVDA